MEAASVIEKDRLIISVDELNEKGLTLYKINRLVDQGMLKKLNKKFYQNIAYEGEESDFYYAYAYVPNGVVCLMSAAVYYDLSTYRPDEKDIMVALVMNILAI